MSTNANAYTSFYTQNPSSNSNSRSFSRPTSEAQLNFYADLCMRKRQVPADTANMSRQQLANAIEELQKLPDCASEPQVTMLKDLIAQLIEIGDEKAKMPSDKFFHTLSREKASWWIEETRKRQKAFYHIMPPTDAQLDTLSSWFLCPDIPWEQFETKTHKVYDDSRAEYYDAPLPHLETKLYMDDIVLNPADGYCNINARPWRKPTPTEFRDMLKERLTHSLASRYIDMYRGQFLEWRRTRIQPGRIKYIRDLERDLATLRSAPALKQDEETRELYLEDAPFATKGEYTNVAYTPIPEEELLLINEENAQAYIDQLRYERDFAELYKFGEDIVSEEYTDRREFDDALRVDRKTIVFSHWSRGKGLIDRKIEGHATFEAVRYATDMNQWRNKEFTALNDFLHALQAISGTEMDGLREDVSSVFFTYAVSTKDGIVQAEASKQIKKQLRKTIWSQMIEAVRNEAIELRQLGRIAQSSEIAHELYVKMITKPKYAKMLALQL